MKKNILAIGSLLSISLGAQTKHIQFNEGNFKTLMETARKENKLIFIDAYTTWCGPCKAMAKNVFTQDNVADYYNANFINAKIDMEKGEGVQIAGQYSVNCYPNLLFIDGNGKLVHRSAGYQQGEEFIALGKTAREGKETFPLKREKLESEGIQAGNIEEYLALLNSACMDAASGLDHYFASLNEQAFLEPVNWKIISEERNDYKSRELQYLYKNHKQFEDKYGAEDVEKKIVGSSIGYFKDILSQNPVPADALKQRREAFKKENMPYQQHTLWELDLSIAKRSNNTKQFNDLLAKDLMTYSGKDSQRLNQYAWQFYEKETDKSLLTKAEEWAKTSVNLNKQYYNMDTYAHLLYKNGKLKEAEEAAKEAIALAKADNISAEEYGDTTKLLEKIKKGN